MRFLRPTTKRARNAANLGYETFRRRARPLSTFQAIGLATQLAVDVKHDKCYSDYWLEDPLQEIQTETGNIEAVSLLGLGEFLQKRLWILRRRQLVKIMPQRCPVRAKRNRLHKGCPNSYDIRSAHVRQLKPRTDEPAAREVSAFA